jgi:hypothetical protein
MKAGIGFGQKGFLRREDGLLASEEESLESETCMIDLLPSW